MKRRLLLIIACGICSTSALFASGNREKKSDTDGAGASVDAKTTIAFIGIESRTLPSESGTENGLRDYFKIDDANPEVRVNQIVFDAFSQAVAKEKHLLVACSGEMSEVIGEGIEFVYEDTDSYEMTSDLRALDTDKFEEVLTRSEAQYLLVIDQYDVRKEGYPYNNFSHVIRYSVYDSEKNKIFNGRHRFSMLDAVDADMLAKQSKKAAGKFLSKL